jgi:hypothetical protein
LQPRIERSALRQRRKTQDQPPKLLIQFHAQDFYLWNDDLDGRLKQTSMGDARISVLRVDEDSVKLRLPVAWPSTGNAFAFHPGSVFHTAEFSDGNALAGLQQRAFTDCIRFTGAQALSSFGVGCGDGLVLCNVIACFLVEFRRRRSRENGRTQCQHRKEKYIYFHGFTLIEVVPAR